MREEKILDLTKDYEPRLETKEKKSYKGKYNKHFTTKMSSTGFLAVAVLFVLNERRHPMYGMEILMEITHTLSSEAWCPSHGTLYPLLDKLEAQGYIEGKQEKRGGTTHGRKFWTITDLGRNELDDKKEEFRDSIITSGEFFNKVMKRFYDGK